MKYLVKAMSLFFLTIVFATVSGTLLSLTMQTGVSWGIETGGSMEKRVDPGDGGLSYVKGGFGGEVLPDDAAHVAEGGPWIMTMDRNTGLLWEAKTAVEGLRYYENTYTWYDPDPKTNGGFEGTPDGGKCTGSPCDIYGYIQALNGKNFGGFSDWRVPSLREMKTLLIEREEGGNLAIDRYWFRRSTRASYYWTSTSYEGNNYAAWRVGSDGIVNGDFKSHSYHVMAVRAGNLDIISPAPGSLWTVGSIMNIHWETRDIPGNVKIMLSRQEGRPDTFEIIADGLRNEGFYEWVVTGPGSSKCVMKIEPLEELSRAGATTGFFAIPYTLTYRAGMNGSIRGQTVQNVEEGEHGTPVEAVPDKGYRFLEWTDGSKDNPRRDMYVDRDLSVSAVFVVAD